MKSDNFDAMVFAREVHKDQRRKYTNNPYFDHLAEVVGIISSIDNGWNQDDAIQIAWLHDCVEDQNVTYEVLCDKFGKVVADGVIHLSDLEKGNRAERKRLSRERLTNSEFYIQNIKLADIISNTPSIVEHDKKFAKVYLQEILLLLEVLTDAEPNLRKIAYNIVNENLAKLVLTQK